MVGRAVRRPLLAATAAYVVGQSAHVTFMYDLVPLALRAGGLAGREAWLFSGVAVAMGLTVVPAGWLADRVPRRRVLRAGVALLALAYAALLVPASMGALLAGTAASGIGLGLLFVSFQSYVADLLVGPERGAAYGKSAAFGVLAGAAGPFLASLVYGRMGGGVAGVHAAAALFAVITAAALALTWGLPTAPRRPVARADARVDLRAISPVMVLYLLVGAGYGMTNPYFAVYFLDHVGIGGEAWGYALAAGTALGAAGSWLAGQGAQRRGITVALVGQSGVLLASASMLLPLGTAALLAGYLVRSLALSTNAPVVSVTLMERVGESTRAQAHGWSSLAWNAGWAVGGAVGGMALAGLGVASFLVGAAVSFLGVALGTWLLRQTRASSPAGLAAPEGSSEP